MRSQFVGVVRLPMLGEVGWRCADAKIEQAHAPRDQCGIFEFAAPHGAVDALFDQIRAALAAAELKLNVRIPRKKARQRRHDDQSRHQRGYFDAQSSAWTCVPLPERLLGLANLSQDGDAARVVGGPIRRHADFAGRSVEQPHPEGGFELLDQRGCSGLRQLQAVGGAGQAARFDHAYEHLHCLQFVQHCSYY